MTKHERQARVVLRSIMARQDVTYKELARKLEMYGSELDHKALSTKINRGKFQFAFFIQCLDALGQTDKLDRLMTK
ncbi:DUF6471 domain-containing protein [Limnobacter litoralis]|uniref:DUF6471 domain-containing protein n=1 Tax=Limnobacter litoralis TaxID=481366 RepID=A0ABQ5YSS6_9BURK|nr:DUF6471 domain-containing protein [Limnobacter litoralis]GLR27684.1 hypothetical protein GCM10007875_27760 [Limnobacter litoralis]